MKTIACVVFMAALASTSVRAQEQKNEVGFVLGSEQNPNLSTQAGIPITLGGSVAFSFDYARHLRGEQTRVFLEVPLASAPSHRGGSSQPGTVTSLATLHVVPSLRLQVLSERRFSPWLSAGFGYGWLQTSKFYNNGAANPQVNQYTGTAQFGGGVDIRTPIRLLLPVSLRAEVRDYYSVDAAHYGPALSQQGQHDVVAGGGFVIHF